MYSNKFVLTVLHNGQVLDEKPNGETLIPLNAEYTIRLRNKHNRRCAVDVYIDGEHATTAGKIIVEPHEFVDLERWVHKRNEGRRFKFVSLESGEAKSHGKDSDVSKNGVIECRFYLEKEQPKRELIVEKHYHHYDSYHYPVYIEKPILWPNYPYVYCNTNTVGGGGTSSALSNVSNTASFASNINCDATIQKAADTVLPTMDCYCGESPITARSIAGATVDGSKSSQYFSMAHLDLETEYTSLKVQLRGKGEAAFNVAVTTAANTVAIKDSQLEFDFASGYCTNCGTLRKADANFCAQCGKKLN